MNKKQFDGLIALTKMTSDAIIQAMYEVMVLGSTQKEAAEKHGVNRGLLSKRLTGLREIEVAVKHLVSLYHEELYPAPEVKKRTPHDPRH